MKKIKKTHLMTIIFFFTILIYSYTIMKLTMDEVWNYGFAYNISQGLVPYKDFNMILTPLYSFLGAPFIKIIGNKLYSIHILNSLIITSIFIMSYKKIGKKALILISILMPAFYPSYNTLTLMLLFLILAFEDKESQNKDIYIGLIVGLLFLTKQTIGLTILIPSYLYRKDKKKFLISAIIPILILITYLIINDALFNFIDYCFLGMLDFSNNTDIGFITFLELMIIIILLSILIKGKFKNKDIFYILMYQIIVFPLFDPAHFTFGIVPVVYIILKKYKFKRYRYKYFFIIALCYGIIYSQTNDVVLNHDKNSFSYLRGFANYHVEEINTIKDLEKFLNNKEKIKTYILTSHSYFIKLELGIPITKYDLINEGNMGYKGDERYINEIDKSCEEDKCLILIKEIEANPNVPTQTKRKIIRNVMKKYTKKEEIGSYSIYSNY